MALPVVVDAKKKSSLSADDGQNLFIDVVSVTPGGGDDTKIASSSVVKPQMVAKSSIVDNIEEKLASPVSNSISDGISENISVSNVGGDETPGFISTISGLDLSFGNNFVAPTDVDNAETAGCLKCRGCGSDFRFDNVKRSQVLKGGGINCLYCSDPQYYIIRARQALAKYSRELNGKLLKSEASLRSQCGGGSKDLKRKVDLKEIEFGQAEANILKYINIKNGVGQVLANLRRNLESVLVIEDEIEVILVANKNKYDRLVAEKEESLLVDLENHLTFKCANDIIVNRSTGVVVNPRGNVDSAEFAVMNGRSMMFVFDGNAHNFNERKGYGWARGLSPRKVENKDIWTHRESFDFEGSPVNGAHPRGCTDVNRIMLVENKKLKGIFARDSRNRRRAEHIRLANGRPVPFAIICARCGLSWPMKRN